MPQWGLGILCIYEGTDPFAYNGCSGWTRRVAYDVRIPEPYEFACATEPQRDYIQRVRESSKERTL